MLRAMERIGLLVGSAVFVLLILLVGFVLVVVNLRKKPQLFIPIVLFGLSFGGVGLLMIGVLGQAALSDARHERDLSRLNPADVTAASFDSQRITAPTHLRAIATAVSGAKLCSRTYEKKRIQPKDFVLELGTAPSLRAAAYPQRRELILTFTRSGLLGEYTSGSVCSPTLPSALAMAGVTLPP
jgi:hypothetical protein